MQKNKHGKKFWSILIFALFLGMSVIPSTGNTVIEKHVSTENFPSDDSVIMRSGLSLITIKVEGEIGENEWYVSDVTFTITYESDEIAAIYYRFDSGEWTEYTESFIASDDGEHILEWYAVDYEGNQSEVDGPFDFKMDQTVPMVDLTWESPDNVHVDFTAICSDATSGMDYVEFYLNDDLMFTDNTAPFEWSIVWTPSLKTAVFSVIAYDKAGNSEYDSPTGIGSSVFSAGIDELGSHRNTQNIVKSTEFFGREKHETGEKLPLDCSRGGDTKPAYVIVVVNKKMGENNWAVSDVTISMIPDPDGIDAVYYKLDEEDWILYNEPIVISQDGAHTLSWYIVDIEGYMSTPESISFKIDQTPPEINLIKERVAVYKVKFTANVYDEMSNIDRVEFYFGSTLQITDYDFPYEWITDVFLTRIIETKAIVYDKAGNINGSSTTTLYKSDRYLLANFKPFKNVIISTDNQIYMSNSRNDTTPPVTTCTLDPPEPNGNNSWYVSDVEVTLNATDDMSGVNVTYYKINEEEWETYAEPFIIENPGYYVIEYYSVDNAGNVEDVKSADFKIDKWIIADFDFRPNNETSLIMEAHVKEYLSGTNKVEFYFCGFAGVDYEAPYEVIINSPFRDKYPVKGLIFNPQFYNDSINFLAIIVKIKEYTYSYGINAFDNAGNIHKDYSGHVEHPQIKIFQRLTFPNNYEGYIGRFLIDATFEYE